MGLVTAGCQSALVGQLRAFPASLRFFAPNKERDAVAFSRPLKAGAQSVSRPFEVGPYLTLPGRTAPRAAAMRSFMRAAMATEPKCRFFTSRAEPVLLSGRVDPPQDKHSRSDDRQGQDGAIHRCDNGSSRTHKHCAYSFSVPKPSAQVMPWVLLSGSTPPMDLLQGLAWWQGTSHTR